MKKNKWWQAPDLIIFALAAVCLGLTVLLVLLKPLYIIPALIITLAAAALVGLNIRALRRGVRRLLGGRQSATALAKSAFDSLQMPVLVANGGMVVWYNDAFRRLVAGGQDLPLATLESVLPELNFQEAAKPEGQHMALGGLAYTVYGGVATQKQSMIYLVFAENTQLKADAREYHLSRPSVAYFMIDTYEDLLKELRESERARIISEIDQVLEEYIGAQKGLIRKIDSSRYLALVEERGMRKMTQDRFAVLDTARRIEPDQSLVGLSVGVGRMGATLEECEEMAGQALDMALGRGGNQAAVKSLEGFEFFGGLMRSVEKSSKVRSRVMANAIRSLVRQSERVLIMGHKSSDMDSLGAAMGMWRFCALCNKSATIVIDEEATKAGHLLRYLRGAGYGADFMSPDVALPLAGEKTLLIVVDTHMPHLLESAAIYKKCPQVVVIDHHRKMVGHIDNAAIFYHEAYASSASELVTEMLEQMEDSAQQLAAPEANALLAGILLDTRTFTLHVGVRTFEAAAYLRRAGAETEQVKRLFAVPLGSYVLRSQLVSEAEIMGGYAISLCGEFADDGDIVAAQAANDLLTIEGVKASVVAVKKEGKVWVSARSMGDVNVQLIMEKLGGGGHMTMAGAQLAGIECGEAKVKIKEAIAAYEAEVAPR